MHSVKVLSAVVALGASLVSGAAQVTCTKDVKISEPTPSIDCDVIDGDLTVDEKLAGGLVINRVKQITGSFIVKKATKLISISSSTLETIDGTLELNGLQLLSSLQLTALSSLSDITLISLQQLSGLTFGSSGSISKADNIRISDTRLLDLSGLNVVTVKDFQIDNNQRLNKFDSDLTNVTGTLLISSNGGANGNKMVVDMSKLESASELQISNVQTFSAPNLATIEKSIKFDTNPELKSFAASNLTKVGESVTFINNVKLTNVSLPELTMINGDMTIQNNTKLLEMDGFPKLETVKGAIYLYGAFEKVELPSLEDVQGTATVTSTTDIAKFCDVFDEYSKSGVIQAKEKCTSDNDDALEGGDGGSESDGSSGGSGSDSTKDDAAGMVGVNMALLGLAGFAVLAQLL